MLDEIGDWVKEQKKSKDKAKQVPVEKVGKVLEATIKGGEKFRSGRELEIARGVLDIISSIVVLKGEPDGQAIKVICGVISVIITQHEPKQPSVIDRLANIVHDKLVDLNKKLHDQKYQGLKRRVSDQTAQLRTMKPGEKLDDPNLWNDYVQFMGELSDRFESPLPFKYDKESLTKDPDVADFVTAVVAYCQAYSCFMALLTAAKGTFANLGTEYKEVEEAVERKIRCQREDAEEKLAFLSDERYLTFLGKLPCEGGKLTKIVVLSRNISGKNLVEAVRGSLNLSQMPDLETVESAATKVSGQSVKLKIEGHQVPPGNLIKWIMLSVLRPPFWVQFINETNFPMKVVSGEVGWHKTNFKFVQGIQPHSSYSKGLAYGFPAFSKFSTGGYLIIYMNRMQNPNLDLPAGDVRVIEFALSDGVFPGRKVNIRDKTSGEFTRGQGTYNAMKSDEAKTLYWLDRGEHYMARAEIVRSSLGVWIWRFVVQNFDPFAVED